MTRILEYPNTPQGTVKVLAAGERYAPFLRAAFPSIEVLSVPANPFVDVRLSSHADLSLLHLSGNRFLAAEYLRSTALADSLRSLGAELSFVPNPKSNAYPDDAALCALLMGKTAFHINDFSAYCLESLRVRQGYAKCVVCPISQTAAITADAGMSGVLRKHGIDVLQIAPCGIALEGFDLGFIGGSAFMLSPDTLAFTGTLDVHPDEEKIIDFLYDNGVRPLFLSDKPIFDIGSAISIVEEI